MAKWIRNLSLIACCCFAIFFGFAGCGGSGMPTFKDNPAVNDVVYGNGSLAVRKGDYLYFANGFMSYEDVGNKNDGSGTSDYASLYRVKLDANGHVVEAEKEYDDEGNEIFDETQAIQNVDILCKKIVGFESMGLYIFGDYIYFATPNNEKDKELNIQSSLIDFCRTRIDRSSGIEKLYTTESENSNVTYTMYEYKSGEVILLVKDNTKLVACKIVNGISQGYRVIEDNISSVALPSYTSSDDIVTELDQSIYYTRSIDSELDSDKGLTKGNVFCKLNLSDFTTQVLRADNQTTYSVLATNGNFVTVSKTNSNIETMQEGELFAISDFSTTNNDIQLSYSAYTTVLPVDANLGNQIIVYDSTNSAIYKLNGIASDAQLLYSGSATLVSVQGNYLYFIANSQLYRVNYVEMSEAEALTSGTILATAKNYFSIDEDRIYYLNNYEVNETHEHAEGDVHAEYYLHMIDLNSFNEDNEVYNHFVGVLMEENYLTESTSDTESAS